MRRPPRSTLSSSSAASDVYKRQLPGHPRIERVMQEQIRQHRRHRRPLWGPAVSLQHAPIGQLYRRLEPPFHVQHHPREICIGLHRFHDEISWNGVEELFDIQVDDPVSFPAPLLADLDRVFRGPPGTVSVRVRVEDRLDLPAQSPRYHRLRDPITHSGYP